MYNHITVDKEGEFLWHTAEAVGTSVETGGFALVSSVNHLAAYGANAFHADVRVTLPDTMKRTYIYDIKKRIKKEANRLNIKELIVEGTVSPIVRYPVISVTAAAFLEYGKQSLTGQICSGMDIVCTKWIGMEGALRITGEMGKQLSARFASSFLNRINELKPELLTLTEIGKARNIGVPVIRPVEDGGIMAALWKLSMEAGMGFTVDMKKIPIRQEIIEVCEYCRLNPYQLASSGCMLMVTEDGTRLTDELVREGIAASIIGRITENHDKILYNGEEIRYLDRPVPDEILKIYKDR